MAIPSSGSISLSTIQTEFGGANPISLSEYYRGGSLVRSNATATIPLSGVVAFSNYRGTAQGVIDTLNLIAGHDAHNAWYRRTDGAQASAYVEFGQTGLIRYYQGTPSNASYSQGGFWGQTAAGGQSANHDWYIRFTQIFGDPPSSGMTPLNTPTKLNATITGIGYYTDYTDRYGVFKAEIGTYSGGVFTTYQTWRVTCQTYDMNISHRTPPLSPIKNVNTTQAYSLTRTVPTGQAVSMYFTLFTNGGLESWNGSSTTNLSSNGYLIPAVSSGGNGFYVRFNRTSGTLNTTFTQNQWQQLSIGQSFGLTNETAAGSLIFNATIGAYVEGVLTAIVVHSFYITINRS